MSGIGVVERWWGRGFRKDLACSRSLCVVLVGGLGK